MSTNAWTCEICHKYVNTSHPHQNDTFAREHYSRPKTATRELTLKEQTTADLLSRLQTLLDDVTVPFSEVEHEMDAIELELEEREPQERKVSRW